LLVLVLALVQALVLALVLAWVLAWGQAFLQQGHVNVEAMMVLVCFECLLVNEDVVALY
jgi:hypothetical protein